MCFNNTTWKHSLEMLGLLMFDTLQLGAMVVQKLNHFTPIFREWSINPFPSLPPFPLSLIWLGFFWDGVVIFVATFYLRWRERKKLHLLFAQKIEKKRFYPSCHFILIIKWKIYTHTYIHTNTEGMGSNKSWIILLFNCSLYFAHHKLFFSAMEFAWLTTEISPIPKSSMHSVGGLCVM